MNVASNEAEASDEDDDEPDTSPPRRSYQIQSRNTTTAKPIQVSLLVDVDSGIRIIRIVVGL
jgi:hypothetical protein